MSSSTPHSSGPAGHSSGPAGGTVGHGPTFILHGYATRMYAFLLWALAAIAIGTGVGYGLRTLAGMALIAAALAVLAWLSYWNPCVILNDDGAAVVNPLRTTRVRWEDIEKCTGQWGLQITPRGGKPIHVWSVPSRAAVRESWAKPKAPQPVVWDQHTGTERLKVTSGRAAEIIQLRAAEIQNAQPVSAAQHSAAAQSAAPANPTVEVHAAGLAAIVLCAAGGALMLFA